MLQHEDSDEDDYEGYFLRPVNGYKISDRIISANKELFEENIAADSVAGGGSGGGGGSSDSAEGTNQRRVTFREDLEDFEPDFSTEDDYEESDIIDDDVFDEIEDSVCVEPEPVVTNGINHPEETRITPPQQQQPPEDISMNSIGNNCKEIEEICEEIEEVIIDKNGPDLERTDTKGSIYQTDDSGDGSVIECCIVKVETKSNRQIEENKVNHESHRFNLNSVQSTFLTPSSPILTSSSSSSSTSTHSHNQHKSLNGIKNLRKISDPKSLKMQLNFKPCCEYKLMESNRLPRYSGYYSQYGLSKEQLEKRDSRQEKQNQRRFEKHTKRHEEEVQRSQINEDAFARWLQNKMRNPRNHLKNMYDYKPQRQQQQQNRGKHKKSS